jgi:HD-GYP domain-containing protein (c-di-GMP phosphodiesterase class II)
MLSILDILKKYKQQARKSHFEPAVPSFEDDDYSRQYSTGVDKYPEVGMCIFSAMNKEETEAVIQRLETVYDEAFVLAKKIYQHSWQPSGSELKEELRAVAEKVVDTVAAAPKQSLRFSLADYHSRDNYLYLHAVNVCLLSVELGVGLGYERQQLLELATGAFLHDIGIVACRELIDSDQRLSAADLEKVKQHPKTGLERLSAIDPAYPRTISDIVLQEHERMDGSGYPIGIKGDDISELGQIVSVADVYEAMLHPRPYRKKYTLSETMKTLLNNKSAFSYRVLKVLLAHVGIFPVGYFVRLNTQEVGVVCKDNPKAPLRPVVSIMFDQNGKSLKQPKVLDLAQNTMISIEECLDCMKREEK